MACGVIYILTNPSFRDYIKIGYASNLEKRLKQLNRSETIPFAFRVYAVYEVENELTDKEVHKLIDKLNPDLRTIEIDGRERVKEFYAMRPEDAYELFECIAKISGTEDRLKRMEPEGHSILDEQIAAEMQETARRGPFRFGECGIPVGSKIYFLEDSAIVATVVDDRRIEYKGETTSLTALAKQLKGIEGAIPGPMWFTYEGEILAERRRRLESEGR